ncbi:MAG: nucleotidyltransferase domain-containing protein [Spirochaetes bacterium]|nr:nucleotidyltransferase domain-containing protein [Spirochaetota bacterium]
MSHAEGAETRRTATAKGNHRGTEVYLFGSLARGEFDENSDIDLAVKGLPLFQRTFQKI